MSDLPQDDPAEAEDLDLDLSDDQGEGDEPELEDGEGDPEPDEGDGEGEDEPRPAARQSRPGRNQRLRAENERLHREMAELRGRVDGISQSVRQPQPDYSAQRQRQEQEFWAALETMTPAEAARAAYQRAQGEFGQALRMQQMSVEDRIDKQAYDAQRTTSTVHQRYADRVEAVIAQERARGNVGITRDAVLKYLLGEDAIARANKAAGGQRQQAQRRVRQQTVQPASGRGDGARGTRAAPDSLEAARARVRNQPLW